VPRRFAPRRADGSVGATPTGRRRYGGGRADLTSDSRTPKAKILISHEWLWHNVAGLGGVLVFRGGDLHREESLCHNGGATTGH
jgi:hypothetical protein